MSESLEGHAVSLEDRARAIIDRQPYFRAARYALTFTSIEKVLLITGQLPSFYLKQVLQNELMRLEGLGRIENQVRVDYALGS